MLMEAAFLRNLDLIRKAEGKYNTKVSLKYIPTFDK